MSTMIHAFDDSARVGRRIARLMDTAFSPVHVHRFPDGESLVAVARSAAHAVLVRSLDHPNDKMIEIILAADALRRAGAQRVTLVAPYLPYMRQDAVFHPGEPLSQRVIGAILARAFDRVLTVAAHLHRATHLAQVVARGSRSLSPAPAIGAWVGKHVEPSCFVVGPDVESAPMIRAVARAAHVRWAVATKERRGDRAVRVRFDALPEERQAVLVDDIASTGATLAAAATALRRRGVRCNTVVAVHALFAPDALKRLRAAGITTVVTMDTIAHPTNAIPCAPILAAALTPLLPRRPRSLDPSIS